MGLLIRTERHPKVWRATLSGFCAILASIGIGRFAYTPLVPALIGASWFAPSQTYYLQAANFVGYLAGALLFRPLAIRISNLATLRMMMTVTTISLFACASPLPFWWFAIWRFASGISGGILMVLATTFVLAYVPQRRLGLVSGIVFAGVAAGIAGSGTAVPFLLQLGVTSTWILFGIFSLLLTAVVWNGWPDNHQPVTPQLRFDFPKKSNSDVGLIFASLCVEYALAAMALVPHMVFIVDFVARGLGYGVTIGSLFWIVFGLSALCGSVLTGWLGDALGFKLALRIVFALEIAAILVPSILQLPLPLLVSTILAGLFVTGSSTIVLGRIQEILRGADRAHTARAWRAATISFALGQGIAAYAFSWLFAATGSYPPLFALGTAALGLALIIDVITNSLRRSST